MSETPAPMLGAVERTEVHWFPACRQPEKVGWYPCLTLAGTPTHRLWEEGAWWTFTYFEPDHQGDDGGWNLVPNNSISYWAQVEVPKVVWAEPAGAA